MENSFEDFVSALTGGMVGIMYVGGLGAICGLVAREVREALFRHKGSD
jgi:hypothetical protein